MDLILTLSPSDLIASCTTPSLMMFSRLRVWTEIAGFPGGAGIHAIVRTELNKHRIEQAINKISCKLLGTRRSAVDFNWTFKIGAIF